MKAEDLTLEDLFGFTKGLVDLHGRRVIIQDLFTLTQFRRDLIEMVGWKQARRIFTRLGYFCGQADAGSMIRNFKWDDIAELLKTGQVLQMLQGVTKTELNIIRMDKEAGKYFFECIWHDSGEAEAYVSGLDYSEHSSCWKLVGYASGFTSFCLDRDIYFIEQKCRSQGDDICLAVGKDVDSWGKDLSPHLEYFHANDIKGKIQKLTSQLREKDGELLHQRKQLEKALKGPGIFPTDIRNQRFLDILNLAGRVAKFDSSILITGETGVGKEVLARLIHRISPRSDGPFIPVNCSVFPETLIESELFGHKAGAFTGATRDQKGLIEEAQGGTIFLDEIGDISPNIQIKLLRVLQEHEFFCLGDSHSRKVDVRVLAATNRKLEQKVAEGSFREDLFYRLMVFQIELPPLRERKEDILPLARHFVKRLSRRFNRPGLYLDASCLDYLLEYKWPGNIRELENTIEHAVVLCPDTILLPKHFPKTITKSHSLRNDLLSPTRSLAEIEMEYIQQVLEMTNGHRAKAAKILKIGEATLYRKLGMIRSEET